MTEEFTCMNKKIVGEIPLTKTPRPKIEEKIMRQNLILKEKKND